MKIGFQGRTTIAREVVLDGFIRHARAYDLELEPTQEGVVFNAPGSFNQMNFAPYQLVDDGTFRVSSNIDGERVVMYSIRSYRIWAIFLLFLVVSLAMGYPWFIFLGLSGAIVLYLYISHYFILLIRQ